MIDETQLVDRLTRAGLLDEERLQQAQRIQKQSELSLYEAIVLHGLVEERRVVEVAAAILNVEAVRSEDLAVGDEVAALVPASMAIRNRVLPVARGQDELVLAMLDPLDVLAMDEVATHTGVDIRPVLIGPGELQRMLKTLYGGDEGASTSDEILSKLDSLDMEAVVDDMLGDDSWGEFFENVDEVDEVNAQSAVISQDMRDRPSTDVLRVDSEAENIEVVEDEALLDELDRPIDSQRQGEEYASLDEWEVDDAITRPREEGSKKRAAQILSKDHAEELFARESSGAHARLEDVPDAEASDRTEVGLRSDSGFEHDDEPDSIDVDSGELSDANHTRVGVGPHALDAGDEGGKSGDASSSDGPDYGELGRRILETSSSVDESEVEASEPIVLHGEETEPLDSPAAISSVERAEKPPVRTPEARPHSGPDVRPEDPKTREMADSDLFALTKEEASHLDEATVAGSAETAGDEPREDDASVRETAKNPSITRETPSASAPAKGSSAAGFDVELPADLSERALLRALLKLLAEQGLVDVEALIAMARDIADDE